MVKKTMCSNGDGAILVRPRRRLTAEELSRLAWDHLSDEWFRHDIETASLEREFQEALASRTISDAEAMGLGLLFQHIADLTEFMRWKLDRLKAGRISA